MWGNENKKFGYVNKLSYMVQRALFNETVAWVKERKELRGLFAENGEIIIISLSYFKKLLSTFKALWFCFNLVSERKFFILN